MSIPSAVDSQSARRAFGVLVVTLGLWFAILFAAGKLKPEPQFDTDSYLQYPLPLSDASLRHSRTIVYPVLLALTSGLTDAARGSMLPFLQYSAWGLAVLFWYHSLRRSGWSPMSACICSIPMFGSRFVWAYGAHVTPDLLALTFSLVAVSFWLQLVNAPPKSPNVLLWIGCSAFCCLSYHTKPAYLFLLPFLPLGGFIARWWLWGAYRDAHVLLGRFVLVGWVPFVAWSTMRWFVVGHFGLVSFGGYNIIGIAGQLLKPEWVSELPDNDQALARSILTRRDERTDWGPSSSYEAMERQFNGMVWQIAVPEALAISQDRSEEANQRLAALSRSVLWNHPIDYSVWLLKAIKHAVAEVIQSVLTNPMTWIAAVGALGLHCFRWRSRQRLAMDQESAPPMDQTPRDMLFHGRSPWMQTDCDRVIQTLVWLGIGFCVAKMGLVILVEPPIDRYAGPAALFVQLFLPFVCWQSMAREPRERD